MISLSIEDGIARLTLARPEARNALRVEDWRRLAVLVAEAEGAGARVLLLRSAVEGSFCAGADLGELEALQEHVDRREPFRMAMRAGLDALRSTRLPVIAAIEGGCFGAGVALAIACDIRVAGPDARFAMTPARLGIGYPLADIARLCALVGDGQAARMLFSADTIGADEAARIGLAELVGADAEALSRSIAANSPASLAMLKRGLGLAAAGRTSDAGHAAAFDALFGGVAFSEGMAAFRRRLRNRLA